MQNFAVSGGVQNYFMCRSILIVTWEDKQQTVRNVQIYDTVVKFSEAFRLLACI